jgi:hypothetical protein
MNFTALSKGPIPMPAPVTILPLIPVAQIVRPAMFVIAGG